MIRTLALFLFALPAFAQVPAPPSVAAGIPLPPLLPVRQSAVPLPAVASPAAVNPADLPPPVVGADFSFGVRIQDFARTILVDVLRAQFVFSTEFLRSEHQVGFVAKDLKKNGTLALLRDVLGEHGFTIEQAAGYYRIYPAKEKAKPDTRRDFVYRLKHRDISYISSALTPLFGNEGLTHRRATQDQAKVPASNGAVDDGKSLLSSVSRGDADMIAYRGEPADIERLKKLLDMLDTPAPQVVVRAYIIETAQSSAQGYSVAAIAKLLSDKLQISIGSPAQLGSSFSFKTPNLDAVASALQGDSSVKVLTAPTLLAASGAQAELNVGNSVPTMGAVVSNNGTTSQSIEYRDTGVILRVQPTVLDGIIRVQLTQELSDAVATRSGVNGSPTITRRSLKSSFAVEPGTAILVGGLSANKSENTRDSLPFYRRVTLGQSDTQERSDIVILLYVDRA